LAIHCGFEADSRRRGHVRRRSVLRSAVLGSSGGLPGPLSPTGPYWSAGPASPIQAQPERYVGGLLRRGAFEGFRSCRTRGVVAWPRPGLRSWGQGHSAARLRGGDPPRAACVRGPTRASWQGRAGWAEGRGLLRATHCRVALSVLLRCARLECWGSFLRRQALFCSGGRLRLRSPFGAVLHADKGEAAAAATQSALRRATPRRGRWWCRLRTRVTLAWLMVCSGRGPRSERKLDATRGVARCRCCKGRLWVVSHPSHSRPQGRPQCPRRDKGLPSCDGQWTGVPAGSGGSSAAVGA
jgi:hypothetical protein